MTNLDLLSSLHGEVVPLRKTPIAAAQPAAQERFLETEIETDRPIFVFGCQRSGTTALTVMLDRHPRIGMMPETQFFLYFAHRLESKLGRISRSDLVREALSWPELAATKLDAKAVLRFLPEEPKHPVEVMHAMLCAYAARHGKARPGEKSCGHLFYVEQLLHEYPGAQFICITRDPRDVVRSLRRYRGSRFVPVSLACLEWSRSMRAAERARETIPAQQLLLLRFEDLVSDPESTLRGVCSFLGEHYDPAQLEAGVHSDVIPDHEREWKGKAEERPDSSRADAWKLLTGKTEEKLNRQITFLLKEQIAAHGYLCSREMRATRLERWWWSLWNVPFSQPLYRWSRRGYRALRACGMDVLRKRPTSS